MKKITDRTIKGIFYGVGIAVLLGLSCVAGIYIEREHQKTLELQKEHVATIAVVNMDNGVIVGDKQINYASQLINFPSENFTVTGLTDAKMGIENGTYAAYIIIPETFSTSVTSIENDPRKAVLEYQYNPNLAETAQIQAMSDVNAFIATFNTNIAYMYVDAVLTEFHRIQDDSSTILANDNSELLRLESVNATTLIEAAEHVEETIVDNNIQSVELTSYTAQNDNLLDSMLTRYMEAAQQAQNDYAAIQETRSEVNTAADNFFSTYNSVIYDTNAEQSDILSEGRINLMDAVGVYNQDVDEQREEVEKLISELIDEEERIANEQLNNILTRVNGDKNTLQKAIQKAVDQDLEESLSSYQEKMEAWLEDIVRETYKTGYNSGYNVGYDTGYNAGYEAGFKEGFNADDEDALSVSDNTTDPKDLEEEINNYISKLNLDGKLEEKIRTISIHWSRLDIQLPESGSNTEKPEGTGSSDAGESKGTESGSSSGANMDYNISLSEDSRDAAVDGIMDLFHLGYNPDEVNDVIQTCFVDRLQDVHQGQMARLDDAQKVLLQNMNDYEYQLENYDPMSYIRDADLGTYLDNIENNARGMLDEVEQNNYEYRTYAEEVYYTTSEHTSQLIDSLNTANTHTTANIKSCIDELISSRQELNSRNVDMLEGFTEALAYTRVGSQGSVEVYDYIINPVVSRTTGEAVPVTDVADTGNEISIRTLLIILLGIGIAACLAVILFTVRIRYKKPEKEKGNIYL